MTRRGHQDVELGSIIGRSSEHVEALRARQTALAATAIMNGQKAEQLAIHYSVNGQVQINMATAIALGISPPWRVLSEAKVVGVERLEDVGLSLTNALELASEHPLMLAAQAGTAGAAADWVAARAGYLPQLHAFANGTTIDADRAQRLFQATPQYDLAAGGQLTQDLLDVAKIVRIKAKRSESHAAAQDLEGLKRDLRKTLHCLICLYFMPESLNRRIGTVCLKYKPYEMWPDAVLIKMPLPKQMCLSWRRRPFSSNSLFSKLKKDPVPLRSFSIK